MNKVEFMNLLEKSLSVSSPEEKHEIIYDYEEHFSIGLASGKTEEEICMELGDPVAIAGQYNFNSNSTVGKTPPFTYVRSTLSKVVVSASLLLFNLIFVLGPFVGVAATFLSLWLSGFAIILAVILTSLSTVLAPILPNYISIPDYIPSIALILFGIGLIALGILLIIVFNHILRVFFKGSIKYVRTNINIITGRR